MRWIGDKKATYGECVYWKQSEISSLARWRNHHSSRQFRDCCHRMNKCSGIILEMKIFVLQMNVNICKVVGVLNNELTWQSLYTLLYEQIDKTCLELAIDLQQVCNSWRQWLLCPSDLWCLTSQVRGDGRDRYCATAKALNEAKVPHLIKDEQTRTSICCQNDYSVCTLWKKAALMFNLGEGALASATC